MNEIIHLVHAAFSYQHLAIGFIAKQEQAHVVFGVVKFKFAETFVWAFGCFYILCPLKIAGKCLIEEPYQARRLFAAQYSHKQVILFGIGIQNMLFQSFAKVELVCEKNVKDFHGQVI